MLFAVITGPTYDKAKEQILQAQMLANGVELRLDYFEELNLEKTSSLLKLCKVPVILTLRKTAHEVWIHKLSTLKSDWIDLEYDANTSVFHGANRLCSYHNFEKTPEDLEAVFAKMVLANADAYKLATLAHSTLDALRMMQFVKNKRAQGFKISGICMGDEGQITRILGPIFGNFIDYASITEANAPGQLTLSELSEIYHYPQLNPDTKIYGLIGDPIVQSPSYLTHNSFFRKQGLDAVYVRMRVKPEELETFFSLAKNLGIKGLSVTIPLKELVLPFLDEIDPLAKEIGAVNTIVFDQGKCKGYNTDASGALDAIEQAARAQFRSFRSELAELYYDAAQACPLTEENLLRSSEGVLQSRSPIAGKRIVILGAGGSAKAIAYEAKRRGGDLVILARNMEKASPLAEKLACSLKSFEEMPHLFREGYDILINCTPESVPIDPKYLLENRLIMDINTMHRDTVLLNEAKNKKCSIVYGYEMFLKQAKGQFEIWFKDPKLKSYELDPEFFKN